MIDDLFDLRAQVAVVTGASSGLGLAIAQALARHGARVVLAGIDKHGCEAKAAELRDLGFAALALGCDLAQRGAVQRFVDAVYEECGRIDVLVCNAGVQGPAGAISDVEEEAWDEVMTVNLRSMVWLTSLVLPKMAVTRRGSVILMSSIAGLRGNKSIGLYSLSKAGVAALARNLAVAWGPSGVTVNAISPGLIRTPFAQGMLNDPVAMERRIGLTPLRRVGEPDEIAGVAVMLASRAGGFISGHNLVVDGGTTIGDGS